jgi:hypothetical protein
MNAYFPYFLFFPDDAPPPASSSSSSASRTDSLHRRASLRPVVTEVRTPVFAFLWTPWPSSRGRMPLLRAAALPLVMPAIEPGWDSFSCRCSRLHQRTRAVCLA